MTQAPFRESSCVSRELPRLVFPLLPEPGFSPLPPGRRRRFPFSARIFSSSWVFSPAAAALAAAGLASPTPARRPVPNPAQGNEPLREGQASPGRGLAWRRRPKAPAWQRGPGAGAVWSRLLWHPEWAALAGGEASGPRRRTWPSQGTRRVGEPPAPFREVHCEDAGLRSFHGS